MARDVRFALRLSSDDAEALDRLAAERGRSRSALIRDLVEEAGGKPRVAAQPPDLERILAALAERAYGGSVEAARLMFATVGKPSVRPAAAGARALLVQFEELRQRRRELPAEPAAEQFDEGGVGRARAGRGTPGSLTM